MNCLTTTGYIVRRRYFETLKNNYKDGVIQLMRTNDRKTYAIDKYWLPLQRKDRWYFLIPPSAIQKPGFSDIEQKHVNFQSYMLNYNKMIKN